MTDELFTIPASPIPPLEAARRRLIAAQAKLFAIDMDGTDDLGLATKQAEKELAAAKARGERISDEHAKQISDEQPELAVKLFTEENAELKQNLKDLTPEEQELVDAAISPDEMAKLEAITKLFGGAESSGKMRDAIKAIYPCIIKNG